MSGPLATSPLGLYFIGGAVIHSDGGPQTALEWFQRNESPEADIFMVGGIQPDSSVIFHADLPEHPVLYFNAKTRKLQLENASKGAITSITYFYDQDLLCCRAHFWIKGIVGGSVGFCGPTELDAYMAAFEALQKD